MLKSLKNKEAKWTYIILSILALAGVIYLVYSKGYIPMGSNRFTMLKESGEVMALNVKEKTYVGINNKQVIRVTRDGIGGYNFQGEMIWSDSFSLDQFEVRQKEPYIAVGTKEGKEVLVYTDNAKKYQITSPYPIIYFSINESGGLVTISDNDNLFVITAYDERGALLCERGTYAKSDGYPVVAELSPNNEKLIMSYVSVDEPQVTSRIYATMNLKTGDSYSSGTVKESEEAINKLDKIEYGHEQTNNLVYEIEFINEDTWVAIGDKLIVWYDLKGNELSKQENLSVVFAPYLHTMNQNGLGYIPMVLSEKPTQNVVHRQDELAYFNHKAEKTFSILLDGGVQSIYADGNIAIVQVENKFTGYNKLGNVVFDYTSNTDVNKVIYIPSIGKGIAVSKESVMLLTPAKGDD